MQRTILQSLQRTSYMCATVRLLSVAANSSLQNEDIERSLSSTKRPLVADLLPLAVRRNLKNKVDWADAHISTTYSQRCISSTEILAIKNKIRRQSTRKNSRRETYPSYWDHPRHQRLLLQYPAEALVTVFEGVFCLEPTQGPSLQTVVKGTVYMQPGWSLYYHVRRCRDSWLHYIYVYDQYDGYDYFELDISRNSPICTEIPDYIGTINVGSSLRLMRAMIDQLLYSAVLLVDCFSF